MTYSEIIIKRISSLCKERGISYYRLEELSGVNLSTIDNIIKGNTKNPRIQTLHKLAVGFGLSLAEFLDTKEFYEFRFDK